MADAPVPGWSEWRARLAGSGPADELAHAFVNLRGQGAGHGEEARTAAVPICDAALYILRRNQILRLSNIAPNGTERLGELLNIQAADLVRFAERRAIEFNGLDQPGWKAMWGTHMPFHEDLIRYLFRPFVYLRTTREWAGLAVHAIMPKAESFEQALVSIIDSYLDVLLRDELHELGTLVERTLPRYPVIREAMGTIDDLAIMIWEEALVRTAMHFNLRTDGAVDFRELTQSLYFVLSGVLKQSTADDAYAHTEVLPRRGRTYESHGARQIRGTAMVSLRLLARGIADSVVNDRKIGGSVDLPAVWPSDRYKMQF